VKELFRHLKRAANEPATVTEQVVVVAAVFVGLLVLIIFKYSAWFESHPGLGTWVQGIGTIGAILAAVIIPILINKRDEEIAHEPRVRALKLLKDELAVIAEATRNLIELSEIYLDEAGNANFDAVVASSLALSLRIRSQEIIETRLLLTKPIEEAALDDLKTIQNLRDLLEVIDEHSEKFNREIGFLDRNPTIGVVRVAIIEISGACRLLVESLRPVLEGFEIDIPLPHDEG
jgi:hypothetical protein